MFCIPFQAQVNIGNTKIYPTFKKTSIPIYFSEFILQQIKISRNFDVIFLLNQTCRNFIKIYLLHIPWFSKIFTLSTNQADTKNVAKKIAVDDFHLPPKSISCISQSSKISLATSLRFTNDYWRLELALTNIFATSVREWGLAERENPPNIRASSNMIDIVWYQT